jgi:hypothetical protein
MNESGETATEEVLHDRSQCGKRSDGEFTRRYWG